MFSSSTLADYIDELGLSFHQTVNSFVFDCPKCGGIDKLYVRKEDGRFRCFSCGEEKRFFGKPEFALAELANVSVREVKDRLYSNVAEGISRIEGELINPFEDKEEPLGPVAQDPIPVLSWPIHCLPIFDEKSQKGLQYLEGRGIPGIVAQEYQIRYSPYHDAVVFPIITAGQLVGWQYRLTYNPEPYMRCGKMQLRSKAWSSPDCPRNKVFMFQDRLSLGCDAVICEGPVDAIKCHLAGVANICSMGKDVSQLHIDILLGYKVRKLYVGLDPDAWQSLQPLLNKVGSKMVAYRVQVPKNSRGKADLGALTMEEAAKCVMESKKMDPTKSFGWINTGLFPGLVVRS